MKTADVITTISPFLKNSLEHIAKKPVILTPPGVNIKQKQKPHNICENYGLKGHDYILFMGRLDSVKRVDLIIRAFKSLSLPNDLKLIIVGDPGPSDGLDYRNYLKKLAGEDRHIIFTGFQSGRIKEELLSNCLLFVLPSVSEGVPIALLESMSYGGVCLASDIPPHRWIIADGENGFLVSTDDFEKFSRKLYQVLKVEHACLEDIGQKATELVRKRFDWDTTANVLEQAYHRAIVGTEVLRL
jgi:glycosyltransferase involved in cell wall biosynthesis